MKTYLINLSYKTLNISTNDMADPICPLPPPTRACTISFLRYLERLSNFISKAFLFKKV